MQQAVVKSRSSDLIYRVANNVPEKDFWLIGAMKRLTRAYLIWFEEKINA
jgi:hypothetical protein